MSERDGRIQITTEDNQATLWCLTGENFTLYKSLMTIPSASDEAIRDAVLYLESGGLASRYVKAAAPEQAEVALTKSPYKLDDLLPAIDALTADDATETEEGE